MSLATLTRSLLATRGSIGLCRTATTSSILLRLNHRSVASFASSANVFEVSTMDEFKSKVVDAPSPTIVDCYADWCGPCKRLAKVIVPIVDNEGAGKVKLAKVNVDMLGEVVSELDVGSIPAVFAYHNGKIVDSFIGEQPEERLKEFVKRLALLPAN